MQTNVHIDTKNLRPSPEHRIKGSGSGYAQRTLEVGEIKSFFQFSFEIHTCLKLILLFILVSFAFLLLIKSLMIYSKSNACRVLCKYK